MRTNGKLALVLATLAVLGWLTACSDLDSGDSADVVLQIANIQSQPVSSTPNSADPSTCSFTLTQWTMSVVNSPKNESATTSPFNDIILDTMTISYDWNNPAITTPSWTVPLGVTVPADSTASIMFFPIAFDELQPAMAGNSAGMSIVIHGRTGSGTGEDVIATGGTTLALNACQLQPIVGACCANNTCQLLRGNDCIAGGGTYLGDNSTCALNPCGGP